MPRRMSCSITVDAVRARQKTVTRRHANTLARHRGVRVTLSFVVTARPFTMNMWNLR